MKNSDVFFSYECFSESKITVENCDNYGTISGKEYVGGIIGGYATAHNAKYIFEGCSNYGRITGTGNSVGGIAGALFGVMDTIKKCANYAQVTSSGNYVAGIVGYDVNVNINNIDKKRTARTGIIIRILFLDN